MFGHAPARQTTVGQARPGNGNRDEVDVFIVLDRFAMPPMLPPKPSILNREEIARSRLFTIEQLDLLLDAEPLQAREIDIRGAAPRGNTVDTIPFAKQQLCQVSPILA